MLDTRDTRSRYVCPECGAWQYVNTAMPDLWIETIDTAGAGEGK